MSEISKLVREQVNARATYRCEYCRTSSRLTGMPLVMDPISPRRVGGSDESDNLAACCYRCNEFKGARTQANDPATGEFLPLFNPRIQVWREHFCWANSGTHVVGLTPTGRATVIALRLNNEYVVEARSIWISQNWHPPSD